MTGMTISNKVFDTLQLRVSPNTINQYRHSLGKNQELLKQFKYGVV